MSEFKMVKYMGHRMAAMRRGAAEMRGVMALALTVCMALAGADCVYALAPETYAPTSKLNSGKWVRVAVDESGMHCISESALRGWGFSNPEKVKVYGYGGKRLPELLDSNYIDDLPQAASEWVGGKGVYFYAEGPVEWAQSAAGYFVPAHNPFTDRGYYFLSDVDEERAEPRQVVAGAGSSGSEPTVFYDRLYHEQDLESPGEAGFLLVGEDFRYTPTRTFQFSLTGLVASYPVRMETTFVAKSVTGSSSLSFTVNGQALQPVSGDNISKVTDKYSHGNQATGRREFTVSSENMTIGITHKSTATMQLANLNYIAVNYPRELRLPAGKSLTFYLASTDRTVTLAGAGAQTRVWHVTDAQAVSRVTAEARNGVMSWSGVGSGNRTFAAWEPDGRFPQPVFVENVRNQNLHGLATADMVIFTPGEWKSEAERIADFHRSDEQDKMEVVVLTPQEVYNEFSSGVADVQAFRKLLKMMYDRGKTGERTLRYALFFSRPTYDIRRKTAKIQALNYPMLPAWFTDKGLNDNDSYMTDDIMGFLEDGSGVNVGRDQLSIAVGRIPATSADDAKACVDKLFAYVNRSPQGTWKNGVIITADDLDKGVHMKDAEKMWENMTKSAGGGDAFYRKVYIDEFELVANVSEEGRSQFYRALDEGVMWWSYQGHGSPTSLTGESLVTFRDVNAFYLRHWPVLYAATCEFLRWDASTASGAEILFKNPNGGVISVISATRPVYIANNGYLSESFGHEIFGRDADGRLRTIGEIYRRAKNNYRREASDRSDTNKLRYVLMGDPAMRMAMPSNRVVLSEVAGTRVEDVATAESPAVLMARQQTTVKGVVTDATGAPMSDFNGMVNATLYDAEQSVTTLGRGGEDDGLQLTIDKPGGRLFAGTAKVVNGEFTMNVAMPAEVENNYRTATFNLYASADDGREAVGVCRDLYVYGTDPDAEPDTKAPWIETMYLNHPSFRDGQQVNSAPMLLATVYDDRAINLSTAGVGHQMAIYLDNGDKCFTNVADYFTPFADGTPGGSIAYPLENLAEGWHTLRLRVWDTAPNSAEASLGFSVAREIAPTLYDVYTDVNPVSTQANFYISHDRPDRSLTVTVEVFDLMGRRLWQATETGRSDMFTSMPLTWDLTDQGGRRVARGIYLYRATVSDEDSGEKSSTMSKKLAVTEES